MGNPISLAGKQSMYFADAVGYRLPIIRDKTTAAEYVFELDNGAFKLTNVSDDADVKTFSADA